jgi:hypothetical protein
MHSLFFSFAYGTLTPFGLPSQTILLASNPLIVSYNPALITQFGLGSFAFARHYLRNHFLIFSSCRYLDVSVPRVSRLSTLNPSDLGVAPFGHLRFYACLRLLVAFRSLPRPSSSLRA